MLIRIKEQIKQQELYSVLENLQILQFCLNPLYNCSIRGYNMEPAQYRILRFKKIGKEQFDFKSEDVFVKKGSLKQMKQKIQNQAEVAKLANSKFNQFCNECQKDFYHQKFQQILFFLLMGFFYKPSDFSDSKQSQKYRFQKCDNGTYHLWKNQKRVMMCKQAFKLVSQMHGQGHRKSVDIKIKIKQDFNVDVDSINQFIDDFCAQCEVCSKIDSFSNQEKLKDSIWKCSDKENRNSILKIISYLKQQRRFNCYDCVVNDCHIDKYQQKFSQVLGCFLHKDFPPQKSHESIAAYKRRIQKLISLVKKCDARKCVKGTYHLWFSNNFQRILMENQKIEAIRQMHQKSHISEEEMIEKFLQQKHIYINDLWKSITNVVKQCQKCKVKGRRAIKEQRSEHNVLERQKYAHKIQDSDKPNNLYFCKIYKKIRQYLNKIPFRKKVERKQLENKFHIGQLACQFILNEMVWYNQSQEQVIIFFKRKGLFIKPIITVVQNIIIHKGFLLYTEKMRMNYLQYGDCLNINFVRQVFKKRTAHGPRFICFLLTGQDENCENVLFAIGIVDNDQISNYCKLFEIFFQEMGGQIPQALITQNHCTSILSVQKFQQYYSIKFPIILSWYSVLKEAKQMLQKQQQREKILTLFAENLVLKNQRKKEESKKYIKTIIAEQEIDRILKYFEQRSSLLDIPSQFIGFCQSTKKKGQLLGYFNQIFSSSLTLAQFGLSALKLEQVINSKRCQNNMIIEYSLLPPQIRLNFQSLENKFSPSIIALLIQQFVKSYNQIRKIVRLNYHLKEIFGFDCSSLEKEKAEDSPKNQLGYLVEQFDQSQKKVLFLIEHDHWSCSCKYQYHSGLPCFHMMPILLQYGNLEYYINKRWERVGEKRKKQKKRQWFIQANKRNWHEQKLFLEQFQLRGLFDRIMERVKAKRISNGKKKFKHHPF